MTCAHLYPLEKELVEQGMEITFRGKAWSENCREWVYFKCIFSDLEKTIERLIFDRKCIVIHEHKGTHDGQEYGVFCKCCMDGIMGIHPEMMLMITQNLPQWV